MPLTQYGQKLVLDYLLGGATATRPTIRQIQFATASPRTDSAFDAPIRSRVTGSFFAGNSPQGSVNNRAATGITAASAYATAICTLVGWNLYDAAAGGNRLAYGTLSASVGCASGDWVSISASALKITLE
jgi:hypothetical protein